MNIIPFFSTFITFFFTFAVYRRYLNRKGTHLLIWTIGLALYGIGTLTEAMMSFTFNPLVLKIWYLSGAMLTAAWLGQGTVHLLVRKGRIASTLTTVLTVVSMLALALVLAAPITDAAASFDVSQPASSQYENILTRSGGMVGLTILLNIYGTITLVGGAIYSAILFWRKKVLLHRVTGNILIAAGALSPAIGGTFLRMGMSDWLYMSELIGAILMYAGFVQATLPTAETGAETSNVVTGKIV
jgi:hypothetical protein